MTRRGNLVVGLTDRELAAGHRLTELLSSADPQVHRAVDRALGEYSRQDARDFAAKLRGTLAYQELEQPSAGRR